MNASDGTVEADFKQKGSLHGHDLPETELTPFACAELDQINAEKSCKELLEFDGESCRGS